MLSNTDNIDILVKILKESSITSIVISPGGTNIAFVKKVQDDSEFTCYSVVDERSAAYFAIGLYLQTGKPVALCCTSAQATRNYVPGLTEAFYKRVPLLAISMMKHPRFTYQEYMQAPDQPSLPNDCVKQSYVLPYISDINDVYESIRVVNQAILELQHNGMGPVQLCVPWLDFPLKPIRPRLRIINRVELTEKWELELDGKKILIVVGEHRPFSHSETGAIERFCQRYDCVVYANLLSNFHSKKCIAATNLLMTSLDDEHFERLMPDIVISIGGQTGDYPLYRRLSRAEYKNTEHWRVSQDGNVVDTYDKLTKVFQCREVDFFTKAAGSESKDTPSRNYASQWMNVAK